MKNYIRNNEDTISKIKRKANEIIHIERAEIKKVML